MVSANPGPPVPRLLPTSAASETAKESALAASSAGGPSAAARPPVQASASYRGPNVAPQSHCSGLPKHTDPTSCFSIADILVSTLPGGTHGEQDVELLTSHLPAVTADDDYYDFYGRNGGVHAAAPGPDSPAWSSCHSDYSRSAARSDAGWDGGLDTLQSPDAGTEVEAGGSSDGPGDWLLLHVLADTEADGDGRGQGEWLSAWQAVDTLLGEPGASVAVWAAAALAQ